MSHPVHSTRGDFDPRELADRLATLPGSAVGRCWIAFSGGLDSSTLLWAAVAIRDRLPGPLAAVHVDHGLHPRASDWRAYCTARCAALDVPCVARALHLRPVPGDSLEAVARAARYAALAELLAPGDLLLTAHTRDDQAETLLLALLRGGGARGLAAMPFAAPLGAGTLVRPLLDVSRAALLARARHAGLDWIEDPSNEVRDFDRNYLRHEIMPRLRARWPAVATTLARSAGHCAEADALVERLAARTLDGLAGSRPGTLAIPALRQLDAPLRRAVLRRWIRQRGLRPPDTVHLRRIDDEVLSARPDAAPLVAWPDCEIRRYRQDLFALRPLPSRSMSVLPLALDAPTGSLTLPGPLGRLDWHRAAPPGAADGGARRWTLRFGVSGLTCRSRPGGSTRSLKILFQEAGIPPWLRPHVPLILADGQLATVAGVCACHGMTAPACSDAVGCPEWRWSWSGHPWEEYGFFGLG